MRNRWDDRTAQDLPPVEGLVYRSRLIGAEESLGLWGGGNTSLKCPGRDAAGRPLTVLWVKGSGCDLRTCQRRDFAPLPLTPLRRLATRRTLRDDDMVAFLERHVLDPRAPRPSIETLLHAFLPETAMDHTHADAILALANTRAGKRFVRRLFGDALLWIPYLQPGFLLSRRVLEAYRARPTAQGAVLEKHGLITWGPTGRVSYGRTIACVSRAERFLARHRPARRPSAVVAEHPAAQRWRLVRGWLPAIRRSISGSRKVCVSFTDTPDVLAFVSDRHLLAAARRGPATPDQMLRTKRRPLIIDPRGRHLETLVPREIAQQVAAYQADHRRYFLAYRHRGQSLHDPSPRVVLVPGVGMFTAGRDPTEAAMVAQVYRHTMAVIRHASGVGDYVSVTPREAFAVEYWPLELYKLAHAPSEGELAREVVLVTGAAGGIGRVVAGRLVDRGACVALADLDAHRVQALAEACNARVGRRRALGVAMDVTDERSIERAYDQLLRTFGGLDALVSNAGVATVAAIDRLRRAEWERNFAVNATGHFLVSQVVIRWLKAQGMGGALVFVTSKNVSAPGKEFGAYSASKAAEAQLARVLAIENGEHGVRVNMVSPDGVFEGSGLWASIGPSRAKTYGLAPPRLEAYYQQRNLLRVRVDAGDVAEAVCFLVSRRAAKTTGCILTVDGGLREAFPR